MNITHLTHQDLDELENKIAIQRNEIAIRAAVNKGVDAKHYLHTLSVNSNGYPEYLNCISVTAPYSKKTDFVMTNILGLRMYLDTLSNMTPRSAWDRWIEKNQIEMEEKSMTGDPSDELNYLRGTFLPVEK